MKLIPKPVEIDEFEGFTPEKDIFQRKHFGENLTSLIENVDDELVVALDAAWGEGKTTFVKMWRGMLKSKGIKSIYFDAYKNDFLEDPFLALVGEIYALIDSENENESKELFKEKIVSTLKIFGRASVRVGMRAITAGVLDDTIIEDAGAEQETAGMIDEFIANRLDAIQIDRKTIDGFKDTLESIASEIGEGKKIVLIVDELDRCKPSFALDLIEKIKHVLSVPGVVFVLVLNRDQMEEIVKSTYGLDIDSSTYLQKFIHLWTGLPKRSERHLSDSKKYLQNCLERMDFKVRTRSQQTGIELYEELVEFYNLSLREIERSLSNFAVIQNLTEGNLNGDYFWLSIFLCIAKAKYPKTFKKLRFNKISYDELIEEVELERLHEDSWGPDKLEHHPLRWLIKCYISSDEERKKLLAEGDYREARGFNRSTIPEICNWMETFTIN